MRVRERDFRKHSTLYPFSSHWLNVCRQFLLSFRHNLFSHPRQITKTHTHARIIPNTLHIRSFWSIYILNSLIFYWRCQKWKIIFRDCLIPKLKDRGVSLNWKILLISFSRGEKWCNGSKKFEFQILEEGEIPTGPSCSRSARSLHIQMQRLMWPTDGLVTLFSMWNILKTGATKRWGLISTTLT